MTTFWIDHSPVKGQLALASRPRGGEWLADDIREWKTAGVDLVVSLLTVDEVHELDLEAEGAVCRENHIGFRQFAIPDRGIPNSDAAARALATEIATAVALGRNVVVHCRQGIGRSGMIAAAVLVHLGITPTEALAAVQKARGREIPDTTQQYDWVLALAAYRTIEH